jgi:hypothetical protein
MTWRGSSGAASGEDGEATALQEGPAVDGLPPSLSTGRPALRFLLVALVALAAFLVVYAAFVLTEAGQRLENEALLGAALQPSADREASLGRLSLISVVSFGLGIMLVVVVAAARRRPSLGVLVGVAMGGSVALAELLKDVLPRPDFVTGAAWILRNGFPSGHAAIGAAIGLAVLVVSPDRLRWAALPVGALLATVTSQATQIVGWHRMSSAVGGVLLVMTGVSLALFVLALRGLAQRSPHGGIRKGVRRALATIGAGAVLLGVAILVISYAFPVLRAPEGAGSAFLHTTLDLVSSGVTILAFVAFSAAIEPYSLGVAAVSGPGLPTERADPAA